MVTEDSPYLDQVVDEVDNYGTDLLVFSSQTESGAELKSFGSIAARLRW
jgi:stalled ribosome rescue protein Dom34